MFGGHRFIRMATAEDVATGVGISDGWSLWEAPDDTQGWLAPEDVMRHGMTERMRAALSDQVEAQAGPVLVNHGSPPAEADERHSGLRADSGSPGGHSPVWRWQRVVEVEETCDRHGAGITCAECISVVWCIDNKPAIEAWAKGDKINPCPELQRVAVPHEILQVIVST